MALHIPYEITSLRCMSYVSILILPQVLLFVVQCKSSSLDKDVICDIKWSDGGVLKDQQLWPEINQKCLETNMLDDKAITEKVSANATLEEFIEVDDNCFVQCTYKADNLLTENGSINKNETMRTFAGNLTDGVLKKAVSIWEECITEAERIAKERKANKCKMVMVHDMCFSKKCLESGLFQVECIQKTPEV